MMGRHGPRWQIYGSAIACKGLSYADHNLQELYVEVHHGPTPPAPPPALFQTQNTLTNTFPDLWASLQVHIHKAPSSIPGIYVDPQVMIW